MNELNINLSLELPRYRYISQDSVGSTSHFHALSYEEYAVDAAHGSSQNNLGLAQDRNNSNDGFGLKEFWTSINKIYLSHFLLTMSVFASVVIMFMVQFKVEAMQDDMLRTENDISSYEDQVQLLEVEWVYLTRPERIRALANQYLKNNGYTLASQIKNVDKLEKYYLTNYEKVENKYADEKNLSL